MPNAANAIVNLRLTVADTALVLDALDAYRLAQHTAAREATKPFDKSKLVKTAERASELAKEIRS